MPSPTTFSQKWEQSRHELLDLSFRNPLLKYRSLKSRGLEFIGANLPETLDWLASEKTLDLLPKGATQVRQPRSVPDLSTPYEAEELAKRTLKTFYDARSSLEEQGVNTLFLAFGFLKWFESDDSEVALRSPLFLLPVELKRQKSGRDFELKATGEEGGINLSLATLLRRDLRLELPDWEEAKEMDIAAYFAQVRAAIGKFPRFEVEENLALAFFSFTKFLMFHDLEEQAALAHDHPVIGSLLGEGFRAAPNRISDGEKLDEKLPLTRSNAITDADSSQMLALEDVKSGHNLVIQGPPGTGKSQTITNIIAQAAAQGKTVLFVSEKMAALQVVKSRLDALGLGDLCLELHSNKTNKKALLGELQRTHDLPRPTLPRNDENAAILDESVGKLNAHAQTINTPIEKSELTLHQIYGRWLQNEAAIEGRALTVPRLNEAGLSEKSATEIARLRSLIAEMQAALARIGPLQQHPFRASKICSFLPTQARDLRARLDETSKLLAAVKAQSLALARSLSAPQPTQSGDAKRLSEVAQLWKEAPDLSAIDNSGDWVRHAPAIEALMKSGEILCALKEQWEAQLQPTAWTSDVAPLRLALETHGHKWFRFLIGEWRQSQQQMALLTRQEPPKTAAQQLEILGVIAQFKAAKAQFVAHRGLGAQLFGARWRDLGSDFAALRVASKWMADVRGQQQRGNLPPWFFETPQLQTSAFETADALKMTLLKLENCRAEVQSAIAWDEALPALWKAQQAQFEQWANNLDRLAEIAALNGLSAQLRGEQLGEFEKVARTWDAAPQGLVLAFNRAHLESLLSAAMSRFPELNTFNGASQEKLAGDFADRDRAQLRQTARAIASRHVTNIEASRDHPEMKILRHEWQKQRAHLAPRKLISKIPLVLQKFKPVMMMSPLSVASYLPADILQFDLVIFDEASQVRPIDAFGALLRGRQAVVAGDSKQLPPTSFFDKYIEEDDEDEDADLAAGDLESILGLFAAQGAPQRMLRWHYRSRHESLIAISNREFYDDKLIVFPSPDAGRQEMGLICHLLPDTVYRSSINREEAKAVARAVMEHARAQLALPVDKRRTLGVAAFSVKQATEIRDQIDALRRDNEELEPFFSPEANEPFFVKNLENVQGDERDVMFLSVGYGRDEYGKVAMRFGPLGNANGERRLNVLISRARLRCEVFTNLRADDLDLSRTNSIGVRALKQFLAYAQTGHFAASLPTGREMDSPFEEEVLRAIEEMGFHATPQVGCAGYFIDLAVQDPKLPGRYVLGVECDGASYHSAANARDRDRLRAQVLQGMGWKLHRIWSTDWFGHRAAQIQRLKQAIESAVNE